MYKCTHKYTHDLLYTYTEKEEDCISGSVCGDYGRGRGIENVRK
jgi:hypothetical protein